MSPASQGALEVERYIGSCLISSSARPSASGKSLVASVVKKPQETVVSRAKQQRDYQQQGSYTSGGEQCQYGTWAGAPLISMTSGPRRNNQRSSPPPSHQSNQQQQPQQQSPQQPQNQGQQLQAHLPNRSPLSRLAIHTQGAPLILAGRFNNRVKIQSCAGMSASNVSGTTNANANNFCSNNISVATGNPMITSAGRCVPALGQRLADASRKPQQPSQPQHHQQMNPKQECGAVKVENTGQNIANIDSLSIASDESSGSANSENSLPRIIKPRKRRKKDRKPASGAAMPEIQSKTEDHHQPQQQQQQQQQQHNQHSQHPSNASGISDHSSIVTLKPYVPVCYDTRYDRGHRRPPVVARESYPRSQSQTTSCTGSRQQRQPIQEIVDTRQPQQQQQQQQLQRYGQRHVQVKVVDDNRNVIVPSTPSSSSMSVRSMGLASKGNSSSYHHRNQLHHVAHHHYHHHHHHNENANGNNGNNNGTVVANGNGIVPSVSRNRYVQHQLQHQHQQQQHQHQIHHQHQQQSHSHDFNEPMLMGCEDSAALVDGPSGSAGCQCRYCDPSGLIWDVDQNGYSPFLTPPHSGEFPGTPDYGLPRQQQQFAHLPLFLSRAGAAVVCQKQASSGCEYYEFTESATNPQRTQHGRHIARHQEPRCGNGTVAANNAANNNSCGVQAPTSATMLRRSWSDPTSYFSEEISVPNRDVGVIGDRGQAEVTRGRSSWPGGSSASGVNSGNRSHSPYGNLANLPASSQGLEVSTEIVTSPNGHRDLEIKFYSSSPCAQPAEEDKSAFLDDGEDFSDIWSYHESKLQQDFRTLLQAEE